MRLGSTLVSALVFSSAQMPIEQSIFSYSTDVERVDVLELLVAAVLEEDLAQLFRRHADERMPAGGDDLAIELDDQRLRDRRAADAHELVRLHADAVVDQHVGEFFESGVTHGGGILIWITHAR